MTTIAWDGRQLAGDTLVIRGGRYCYAQKVFRLKAGLLGLAGTEWQALKVKDWVNGGPKPDLKDLTDVGALWITKPEAPVLYLRDSDMWVGFVPVDGAEKYATLGTGLDFALAGMVFGLDAVEAVKFATRFDASSGGDVDVVTFETTPEKTWDECKKS